MGKPAYKRTVIPNHLMGRGRIGKQYTSPKHEAIIELVLRELDKGRQK